MTRIVWWISSAAALLVACKDTGGNVTPDGMMTTSCQTDDMCAADQVCDQATKKCGPMLEMRGFTASVESFMCSPPGQELRQCAAYRTSFVLHQHSMTESILRLERMKLTGPNGLVVDSAMHCANTPWMLSAASMSGALDVVFDWRGGPTDGGWPAWAVPCGASNLSPEIVDDIGPAPTTGELELQATLRVSSGPSIEVRARATLTPF